MVYDTTLPRPDNGTSSRFTLKQCGHIGRGGKRKVPQSPHFWPRNSSLSDASQKNFAWVVMMGAMRVGLGGAVSVIVISVFVGAGHARDSGMNRGHGPLLQECVNPSWELALLKAS